MTQERTLRGVAAVGHLAELPPVEAAAVLYFRLWHDGPAAQAQVIADFTMALGPHAGREATQALDQICELCARLGRRPLMRHHLCCKCLGADEACFAQFIAAASDGDREDAVLIATLLVRADMAPSLASLAEFWGLSIKRLSGRSYDRPMASPLYH
ncbi:hypothetical protein [Pseudoruegeria sp. SK021]|uniref:hypothetical protein n=1 Tax=Pseudoruegeria sp. SK021 TaxID=1933035 RepID=UPI000A230C85|nr:hypothetical protein [Pseudoruegeria sp. SK021]OSP55930.1 hypothetical protein BV911_04580 [Pseudoruegeria sp. SK021]